jgi:broad specificity phosphatase PhoE
MKRRFQIGNNFYEIPNEMVNDFLSENPKAVEVKYYNLGGSEYNVPMDKIGDFETDMGLKKKDSWFSPSSSQIGSLAGSKITGSFSGVPFLSEELKNDKSLNGTANYAGLLIRHPEENQPSPNIDSNDPLKDVSNNLFQKTLQTPQKEVAATTGMRSLSPVNQKKIGQDFSEKITNQNSYSAVKNLILPNAKSSELWLSNYFKDNGVNLERGTYNDNTPLGDVNSMNIVLNTPSNNETAQAAMRNMMDRRNLNEILQKNNYDLDKSAIDYYSYNNDGTPQSVNVSDQAKVFMKNKQDAPQSFSGALGWRLMKEPVLQELQNENPNLNQSVKEQKANFLDNHPEIRVKNILNQIAQGREDYGLNNPLINIGASNKADDIVDRLTSEGKMTPQDREFYLKSVRLPLKMGYYSLQTPGVVESAFNTTAKSIEDLAAGSAKLTGARNLYSTPSQNLAESLDDGSKEGEANFKGINKFSHLTGNMLGVIAPILVGTKELQALNIAKDAATEGEILTGLTFYNDIAKETERNNPNGGFSNYIASLLKTTVFSKVNKFLPKMGEDVAKSMSPEVDDVVNKLKNDEIKSSVAKNQIINSTLNKAYNLTKAGGMAAQKSFHAAAQMSIAQGLNDGIDGIFSGKFDADETANKMGATFESMLLGTSLLNFISSAANKDMAGKSLQNMAENYDFYKQHIINESATNSDLAKQSEQLLNNLDFVKNVNDNLPNNLSPEERQSYLLHSLNSEIQRQKLNAIPKTEENLRNPIQDNLDRSEGIKNNILNSKFSDEQKILNQALSNNEIQNPIFINAAKDALQTPEKSNQFLKEASEQFNSSESEAKTAKNVYGQTIFDAASKMFPKTETKEDLTTQPTINYDDVKKQETKTTSVILPKENKPPNVIELKKSDQPQTDVSGKIPVTSDKIVLNDKINAADLGSENGKPLTDEWLARQKEWVKNGDVTMSGKEGDGETAKQVIARVIPEWEKIKNEEKNNTTVVTSSSALKAINVWEDKNLWKDGKPKDPANMTPEEWKKFATAYNKEDTETGDRETFKGTNGDINVIRHGETYDNKNKLSRTKTTRLTSEGEDNGIDQSKKTGRELNEKTNGDVPKIISGEYTRTVQTSNIIADELGKGNEDVTSIKNETTRLRREQMGLDKEIPTAKKEFGKTWDEAKLEIEDGYNPQNLVDELYKKPRPLSDKENAMLLHYQNTKELQYYKVRDKMIEAAKKNDAQAVEEHKVTLSQLRDELQRIYDVDKAVGIENARGLASRAMMVDRKYSLASMVADKMVSANDGKPLSEEQVKNIEELHKKIKDTQKEFDDYRSNAESEIKGLQEKILGRNIKDRKSAAQKLREWADKVEKSNLGKANLPEGTKLQGVSFDINKLVANGMRLIADALEKGGKLIDIIKDYINDVKKENPDVDEKLLNRELNKAVINSGIVDKSDNEIKRNKDLSGLILGNKLDSKGLKLKAASERAKEEFDISIKQDEMKKRNFGAKAQDVFVKWQRGFKLSNPITVGKLMMAGFTRLTTTPLEDIVGGAYSYLMPKFSKDALGEGGGLRIKETADAYKNGLIRGMKDSYDILKRGNRGKSDIDTVFGKSGDLPPEAIDFFGRLHSATKAPIKRVFFEKSLAKRLRRNIANGVDVSDPLAQTEILTGAYKDANRAIFMQDNKISTAWQNMVKYFEKNPSSKPAATALQWLLPFVKVPTNIAAEIGTNIYGLELGMGKLLYNGFTKGINNLSVDQKDLIMRQLKKGTIGTAALLLGYFNPQTFGGYYQQGEKRKEGDAKADHVKIFGVQIPAWIIESPVFQTMQIGATIRRVKDTKVKGGEKGLGEGVWAGLLGLANHVPMIDQPMRLAHVGFDEKERQYYFGELAKGTVSPALLSYFAKVTDPADKTSVASKILDPQNKREMKSVLEHIKSGIPILRETLPQKK